MAQNPPCMIEGCEQPASFTGTFFSDGSSITVCGDHFIDFAAGTLGAMTGVPVAMLIQLPPETFADEPHHLEPDPTPGGPTSPELSEVGTASDHLERINGESDEQYEERLEVAHAHDDTVDDATLADVIAGEHDAIFGDHASSPSDH